MTRLEVRVLSRMAEIPVEAWDRLVGDDDPFVEHAFLHALEASGSVGPGTGWEPCHLAVSDDGVLVAALPLYAKTHSYGEFIFDFAWADAARRMRSRYYPKLVSMVPLTPATGRRFLVAPDRPRAPLVRALLDGVARLVEDSGASSARLLFLDDVEIDETAADPRYLRRATHQYHFVNEGYASFEDFLARFRSEARKQVKKERRIVAESGLSVRVKTGEELDGADWDAIRAFYLDTCARKGSPAYLDESFFDVARETLASRVVSVLAYDGGRPVAATLNFEKGKHLYGRYWGASDAYEMLHFELCYYRLIERAIAKGMTRFEAGAQGEHKIKRGLLPRVVHSAHAVVHPILRAAVEDYLLREASATRRIVDELSEHGPFRRA